MQILPFGGSRENLSVWFQRYQWGVTLEYHKSAFLPPQLGLTELEYKAFTVKVSNPTQAILECLYLAPQSQPLLEVFELIEGLNNLHPMVVQKLLKACTSVKVKRLFLYLAEKAGYDWFDHLKLEDLDLGSGERSIVDQGAYVSKYQIIVPKELELSSE